ncbi:TVP38/TMEM64 family protein [Arthrobacter rhombi]|uniref:TVP38/TMEM64 family protein n=1 Tax=Arthrobacter rhombi TaxID=71253 RepID=UPI003FD6B147
MNGRRRALVRLTVLVVLLAILSVLVLRLPLPGLEELRTSLRGTGGWGMSVFVLGYAALTLSPVPKSVLSVAAGLVFGFWAGIGLVYGGAMLGAAGAFWLGRWLGRDAVEKFTGTRVRRVDDALRRRGTLSVIGLRLVPVLPFTAINYAAGLTSISWGSYFLGTALGILPGTAAYVTLGAYGTDPGWQLELAAAVLGVLILGGVLFAAWKHRKERKPHV